MFVRVNVNGIKIKINLERLNKEVSEKILYSSNPLEEYSKFILSDNPDVHRRRRLNDLIELSREVKIEWIEGET